MGMVATTFRFAGAPPGIALIREHVERASGSPLPSEVHSFRWDMRGTEVPPSVFALAGGPGPFDIEQARWTRGKSVVELHLTVQRGVLHVRSYLGCDLGLYEETCRAAEALGGAREEITPEEKRRLTRGVVAMYALFAVVMGVDVAAGWYCGVTGICAVSAAFVVGTLVWGAWCVRKRLRAMREYDAKAGWP
jgi:hypothetical protein